MRKIRIIFTLFLALNAPAASTFAAEIKFEASLDRNKVAIGEAAQLGLSFQGTQSMLAPDIGNIDGLEIRYAGPSTMMTVINGQVSSSITHMYKVAPLRLGKFQIGPFSFKYKGNSYSSNMVFLEVVEANAAPAQTVVAPAGVTEKLNLEDRIFLKLEVAKRSAYVNELIPVKVKFYVNRLNASDIQLPTFDQEGFSKIEFKEPKQYRENLNGLTYDVLEFKTNIFGTRSGDYKLGPAKIKCNIIVRRSAPRRSSMRDDYFDDEFARDSFFDNFTARYERYPTELKSQAARIIVSAIPSAGRPQDFSGAVGDYQFIYRASPLKVKVGDPITVSMIVNGLGNFNTVLMPTMGNTDGFKVYEAQVNTEENSKTFTQVLMPESDLVTRIPEAVFNYFDPRAKEYKKISQGPIAVKVEKAKEEAPSQVVGPAVAIDERKGEDSPARDIIYIKEAPSRWRRQDLEIYKGRVFLTIIILPLLFLIALSVIQARRMRRRRDHVYAGRIASFRIAKRFRRELYGKIKAGDCRIFYEALFKVLQEYIGHRLLIPPAGVTADVAERELLSRQVDLDVVSKARGLFRACDEARFSFARFDEMKMRDDLKEAEEVIGHLERKKI